MHLLENPDDMPLPDCVTSPPVRPGLTIGLQGVIEVQLLLQLDVDVHPSQKEEQDADAQGCSP